MMNNGADLREGNVGLFIGRVVGALVSHCD